MAIVETTGEVGFPNSGGRLWSQVTKYVVDSVPAVTAETLAIARVVFGSAILFFWLSDISGLDDVAESGAKREFVKFVDQTAIITYLSSSEIWSQGIYWTIAALLIAFIIGMFSRVLYPALVLLICVATLMRNGNHTDTPLILALLVTLPVPWSAAWSFDSLLRRKQNAPTASPVYGYGIWLLGFTIAITYASAGITKLIITKGAWLWETGARNGFIQDFDIAATDWGMYLVNNYSLAFIASVLSAFGQAIYLYSCFTKSAIVKYAICFCVAIPFVVGLFLFMGHFWWAWAVLIMMLYLPWATIDRFVVNGQGSSNFEASSSSRRHRNWFISAATALVALHVFAVTSVTEFEPLYSNYPMYAKRMLAESEPEKQMWAARASNKNRNFKYSIQLLDQPNSQAIADLQTAYHLDRNLLKFFNFNMGTTALEPDLLFASADSGLPLKGSTCDAYKRIARDYASRMPVTTIRFQKRYVDLVGGRMVWLPVTTWIDVDIVSPDCAYSVHPSAPPVHTAGP